MKKGVLLILGLLCLLSYSVVHAKIISQHHLLINAEHGNAVAEYKLAHIYNDVGEITQDHNKAFYWYRKAAKQGYAAAMYNLAHDYDKGLGTTADKQKAIYWYQRSSKANNFKTQNNLPLM